MTASVPTGEKGNLGRVSFRAFPSPAIQLQRRLARAVPMISRLAQATEAIYRRPDSWLKDNGTAGRCISASR